MHHLIYITKLPSVKREIIVQMIPALSASNIQTTLAASLTNHIVPSSFNLVNYVRASAFAMYRSLLKIICEEDSKRVSLIQSILYAFSIEYSPQDFTALLDLDVFSILHDLLQV